MDSNFSVTRKLILEEATERGHDISFMSLEGREKFLYGLSDGDKQVWLRGSLSTASSATGNIICRNKALTLNYAESLGYEVPPYQEFTTIAKAIAFMHEHHPIVVKLMNSKRIQGATIGVHSEDELRDAIDKAKEFSGSGSSSIILQQFVRGNNYNFLIIGDRLFAAVRCEAPYVVGDGLHTVAELIGLANLSPDRSTESDSTLRPIDSDIASSYLAERMQAVLDEGEVLEVVPVPLISQGAQTYDVTDEVHPSYAEAAVRFSQGLGLAVCGINIIALDITQPMDGMFPLLEANSMPDFGMHYYLTHGESRNAAPAFLDVVFG